MRMRNALLLVPVVAAVVGCSGRNTHNVDTIRLTPEQEKDVFLTSSNLGPESNVIVLATVPKARYENGAIVLTGGREVYVVQPHAWRTYTGTAISTEEASRMIARAERLEVAVRDVGAAASDLRIYLESRSSEAKVESERMRQKDEAWRSEQERQSQKMLDEAGRLRRSRDQEITHITSVRDETISAVYKEGSAEIQAITDTFSREVAEINERYAHLEASESQAYTEKSDKMARSQKLTLDVATSKQATIEYIHKLEDAHERERQALNAEHSKAVAKIQSDRDNEIARLRSDSARKIDDSRRLFEEKAERIRKAADTSMAEVRAKQAMDAVQLPAAGPSPAATSPAPIPSTPATPDAAPAPLERDDHAK